MERVGLEDVRESLPLPGRDQRAVTGLHERPDGVLPARAAAEIAPDDEHGGTADGRVVQGKIRSLGPVLIGMVNRGGGSRKIAPVGEEQGAETGALDALEIPRGNDQIGVDISPIEYGQSAAMRRKWLHGNQNRARSQRLKVVVSPGRTAE